MKIFTLLAAIFLTLPLFGQQMTQPLNLSQTKFDNIDDPFSHWSAGSHLIHAKKLKIQSLTAFSISAGIGGVIIANASGSEEFIALGGVVVGIGTLISLVMNVQSAKHIGMAGKKLNNITLNKQGIGFKYSF
jgi:hypothetical protein